ncbi:MAG: hypothetical protein CSA39_04655 [Flavobacteriales bacterium]|nr:MAG: hypothetical protein CSA39_04655 [Flavobacteriales bacterium]
MKSTQTTQKCNFIYVTLFLLIALLLLPLVTQAQTTVPFAKRYETQGINGDLTIIGNSILGDSPDTPYNGDTQNNYIDMVYVDIDNDPNTFNSSSAKFTTGPCNRVIYAGLYWGAIAAPSNQTSGTVKFKIPGGSYQDVTADINFDDMIYYKDVTSLVTSITNPNGDYFVANLNSTEGANSSAGWSLVLVYEDPNLPRKYISTFDGLSAVTSGIYKQVDFNYSGFTTPPSGPVEGTVGVVALEGDLGWYGDQMLFKADGKSNFTALYDAENELNNFFNSKITNKGAMVMDRNLNSSNTLGWDQKILDLTALNSGNSLIGNGETGATVRVKNNVGGDYIYTFLNTFSVNIIEPVLRVVTSVEDTNGNVITHNSPVQLGATVWYDINFRNIGTDNAQNTYILNTLPINVTLDESSIELPTGVTYSYNSATRELRFDIDDSLVRRETDPDKSHDIRYMVTASNNCFDYTDACTNKLENILFSYYDGETSGQNVSGQPGLIGVNGCGLGTASSMDLFVDTSSCQYDSTLEYCNDNLTISGDDGYNTYEWVDQNGNNIGNTKVITVDGPGVYTVTQTKIGCTITERVVTVLGLDVTFTPSDALCKDSANGKIAISVNDDAATFTYELLQGSNVISSETGTSAKSHTFSGLDIGTYTARVTNEDGCFRTTNFTISEPTLLQASNKVIDNIMPCNGNALSGSIEITGTGGTAPYQYSINGGTSYQTENIFNVTKEGEHVITVKDANGCTTTTKATIDFDEDITYDITKEDVVCMGGSDGKIAINVSQNTAGNTLSFSKDGGNTFQNSSTFANLTKGEYNIVIRKVKGKNTCDIKEIINLTELVDLQFEASTGFSCEGYSNQIIATVANQYANEVEYTLDGSTKSTTGVFEDVADGQHTVTVINTTTGCGAEPITLQIESYTPISIDVVNSATKFTEYTVNASYGKPDYLYAMLKNTQKDVSPEVSDNDFGTNNVFTISGAGFYTFYVKDANGCIEEKIIEVEDIEIPNFFTPNGDGTNETWYPKNIQLYPDITVKIFDRYQRLIVSLEGIQQSWDGIYKGKLLPSGDYWYIIKLNNEQDNREFKGNFTLLR